MTPHHLNKNETDEKVRGAVSDERFRKKEHLLKSKDFNKVYKRGRAGRSDGVVLYCLPNALGGPHKKLGGDPKIPRHELGSDQRHPHEV